MNPQCVKCKKTVYPMEKLFCMDKVWHKMCFTCEICGMTLTLKTYKEYNKIPYCSTHVPTEKHVTISPEAERLKKNTSNQSGIEYTLGVGGSTDNTISPEAERLRIKEGNGGFPSPPVHCVIRLFSRWQRWDFIQWRRYDCWCSNYWWRMDYREKWENRTIWNATKQLCRTSVIINERNESALSGRINPVSSLFGLAGVDCIAMYGTL